MRRREFITMLGGAAATWPIAARAQQQTMPVVGVLDSIGSAATLPAFRDGLAQMGYVAGRNVALDVRSTDNYDRLPELARDLASGPVAAIAALGGPSAPAAKAASATIPIVFTIGGDPLELGLVASISRPGGNITGVTFFTAQLLQKQIGLVHELLPNATLSVCFSIPKIPAHELISPVPKALHAASTSICTLPMRARRANSRALSRLSSRSGSTQ